MQPRKILVATDLSEAAGEAVRQADAWARATGAELIVCHVMPNPLRSNMLFPQLHEQVALELPRLRERAVEEVTRRVTELTGRGPEEFTLIVDDGTPHAIIIERAERRGVDLIVVGSHGRSGIQRILLGSVAEQVVRYAHCPVLIARPAPGSGVILAATDFSDPAQPAVAAAAEEAKRRGAKLVLMHAIDIGITSMAQIGLAFGGVAYGMPLEVRQALRQAIESKLAEAHDRVGVPGDIVVAEGSAAAAIVQVAEERRADLLVVGTAGLTGLKRLTLGSVAEAVARSAPCPVLVVRKTA